MSFTWKMNWRDDYLDSRDIIERYDDLTSDHDYLVSNLSDAELKLKNYLDSETETYDSEKHEELQDAVDEAQEELDCWLDENTEEFDNIKALVDKCEGCSDWLYGETLIIEHKFTDYIEELINDCYEIPKEFNSGEWPWRHMIMNYDAAAEEAKQDYTEVNVDGQTYLIRS